MCLHVVVNNAVIIGILTKNEKCKLLHFKKEPTNIYNL